MAIQYRMSEILRYRDFVIELRSVKPDTYSGRVTESPVGETAEFPWRLTIQPDEIEEALSSIAYSSGSYLKRSNYNSNYDPIIALGQRLYQELLRETPVGRLFRQAQETVQSRLEGLRLRIVGHDRNTLNLPWEFLYDTAQSNFLALSLRTPIVRRLLTDPNPTPVQLQPAAAPLRMLVVTAEVSDFEAEKEIEILHKIQAETSMFDLHVLENASFAAFADQLRRAPYEVVHLIATGAYGTQRGRWSKTKPADETNLAQGMLFMGDDAQAKAALDKAEFVPAGELRKLLAEQAELRFVVLNGCDTDLVAAELAQVLPAVLGVRGTTLNWSCQAMTEGLYEGLAAGQTLEAAVTLGRQTIDRRYPGTREWVLPTFYLSAPHGILFMPNAAQEMSRGVAQAAALPSEELAEAAAAAPPVANPREQRRLASLLELEQRNLDSLHAQRKTLGDATPDFVISQITAAEQKVAHLKEQLAELS